MSLSFLDRGLFDLEYGPVDKTLDYSHRLLVFIGDRISATKKRNKKLDFVNRLRLQDSLEPRSSDFHRSAFRNSPLSPRAFMSNDPPLPPLSFSHSRDDIPYIRVSPVGEGGK